MFSKTACALALAAAALPAFAGAPNLNAREHNQRDRIAQGVRSGELNRLETRRLVQGEVGLHRAERRAKSDGVVTRAERWRLDNRADRMSARIYSQKHD